MQNKNDRSMDTAALDDLIRSVKEDLLQDTQSGPEQYPEEQTVPAPIEKDAGEMFISSAQNTPPGAYYPEAYDAPPELPDLPEAAPEQGFEPNFGNAFDDYGDYEEPDVDPAATRLKQRRHVKKFKLPLLAKLAIYLVIVFLLGKLAARVGWQLAVDVLALTRPNEDVEVTINENDELDDIAKTLKEVGAIKYEWLFKLYCKFTHSENYFDPGVYTINLTYDYHALVNNLMADAGRRETITLMIAEGTTCYEIFDLLEQNGVCSRTRLEETAANYEFEFEFLKDIPYGSPNRLEGYLFPDTYQFYLKDDPEAVIGRFLRNFNSKMNEDYLEELAESGYTMQEILTMASIIEAENDTHDNDRGLIAGVMYNRLADWKPPEHVPFLNMDSTVKYGAMLLGAEFDLTLDSPYNTYTNYGLPPGPICNPGMKSIKAALEPKTTINQGDGPASEVGLKAYYFATNVDGYNEFYNSETEFYRFINGPRFIGNKTDEDGDQTP